MEKEISKCSKCGEKEADEHSIYCLNCLYEKLMDGYSVTPPKANQIVKNKEQVNMEKLMLELLEKCKTEKKLLLELKSLAVSCQMYELTSNLRGLEKELFPATEEEKIADKYKLAMQMVGISPSSKAAFIISEIAKVQSLEEFSLQDAAKIKDTADTIFGE